MTLRARKHAELSAKCRAFGEEMDRWAAAVSELPQHTSQIRRLVALFKPFAAKLEARIAKTSADEAVARNLMLSAEVLVLYRTWAFYRQKLDQRFVRWQKEFLEVADDLAYRWWRPAQQAALKAAPAKDRAKVAKEPPLVFLNGDVSPFTITRLRGFSAEVAQGLDEKRIAWARELLRRSPVPVVGVPYFAARHVPDLMVIAHEVGHNVEDDFELTEDLGKSLQDELADAKAPQTRRDAWSAWLGETFADVWGVLSAGPAFVDALIGLVADDPESIATEERSESDWGTYPTVALRLKLLLTTLRALHLEKAADARQGAVNELAGAHRLMVWEGDLDAVVRAILSCKPARLGRTVRQASLFDPKHQNAVMTTARSFAQGFGANGEQNTAFLAQAITLAFGENPAALAAPDRNDALWTELRSTVTNGVRAAPDAPVDPDTLAARDAALADELFATLTDNEPGGA